MALNINLSECMFNNMYSTTVNKQMIKKVLPFLERYQIG